MRALISTLALTCLAPGTSIAFDLDIQPIDAARQLGAQYVSELAVNDRAAIDSSGICVDGGRLFVMADTELDRLRVEYSATYWVTREVGGAVRLAIEPSKKTIEYLGIEKADNIHWPMFVNQLRRSCNSVATRIGSWIMLPISTVNGYASLSALIAAVKPKPTD